MDVLQSFLLALIQGITEFLPISSSAHLILPSLLLGWEDQGLAFDTAVHLGSLIAVVVYFRSELLGLTKSIMSHWFKGEASPESQFGHCLLIASLPIIPAGFLLRFLIESEMRTIEIIALTTFTFAIALLAADLFRKENKSDLTYGQALMIGFAQCLALIPGTSRSGVTITMALLLGHTREYAARISFLIAIPAIAGAATIKLIDLMNLPTLVNWTNLAVGAATAAVSAYLCIALFLNWITRIGFLPFVIYRVLLSLILVSFLV